jgi:pimeloyl-ACP methyl ester carboxylesterase
VVLAAGGAPVSAQTPQAAPNDYSKAETWLCRPGRTDACAVDLNTTIVAANGTLTREAWTASPNAPIDCFYVYPTVSTDQGQHSDMNADAAELNVVRQQFARFGSLCRPYAPLYRQVTLSGLMRGMAGGGRAVLNEGLGYDDVRDAWRYYLEHDNQGRGVVLIGHSQGSYILTELVRQEIDGKPVQSRLVSAILLGATIAVPKGKDVGGAFQSIPLCRRAAQVGCLIAYSAFRATVPPPANTLFGRVDDPSMEAACVNPAALGGTASGALRAYLATDGRTITGTIPVKPWVTPEQTITTPWVSVPGLLTARCATNEHANYLEITVNGDANDPRVDEITGDIGGARPAANWGLHLIDVNLAQGNLLDIVSQQTKAYLSRR